MFIIFKYNTHDVDIINKASKNIDSLIYYIKRHININMKFQQRTPIGNSSLFTGVKEFGAKLLSNRTDDTRPVISMATMLAPHTMKDLFKAADVVYEAIQKNKRIVIVADYDADGATGCAIGLNGLAMFGANVGYIVPNRFTEGYGLSPKVVERALPMKPDLFLTVDNGIASFDGIAAAYANGIPVVVTDHHDVGKTIPEAEAIVNPKQSDCNFQSKNIAGCGVMFYLMIALRMKFRDVGDSRGQADLKQLLDILALGTVADVVNLDYNNRVIVHAGLQRIRQGTARAGILKLFDVAKRNAKRATSMDLGFYIGPRINAAGRLDDAGVGIACLATPDDALADRLAVSLHATNQERRSVQKEIENEAISGLPKSIGEDQVAFCLFNNDWHEGVIGIVSGRIKELFYRPTIVFTQVDETSAKGSGRSIPGLNMRDCLERIDRQAPGLIKKFGGHPMAAGLTIDLARMDEFKSRFDDTVRSMVSPTVLRQVMEHDGVLRGQDITTENCDWIADNVWGQGFLYPQFIVDAPKILSQRVLKDAHLKLDLEVDGVRTSAIWFGQKEEVPQGTSLLAKLDVNEWQGARSPQLMIDMEV